MNLETVCCCGHAYADHKHREPHPCCDCVCTGFQRPKKQGGWRTSSAPPDPVHLAALKAPQRARRAALNSIEPTCDGEGYRGRLFIVTDEEAET